MRIPLSPDGLGAGLSVECEMENLTLALRPARREVAFGAEDVAVEICHPLPTARSQIEIPNCALNMRRHALPVKLRIKIGEIGRRAVAELLVHSDFVELVIQGIG